MSNEFYPGGKGATFRNFINLMPPHRVYIEAFLGSGAVMRNKRPAQLNIGIEANPAVFKDTREAINPFWQSGGSVVRNGVPISYRFIEGDCLTYLASYPFGGDELVYFDPPYLLETRKQKRLIYLYEYSDDDHLNFLRFALNLPCMVMISGYYSDLYSDMLASWYSTHYTAVTRGGSLAEEYVWMNYPKPVILHDFQYVGNGHRERQRIKKKMRRHVAKLKGMSDQDRAAVLWALQEAGFLEAAPQAARSAVSAIYDDGSLDSLIAPPCYS